MKIRTLLILSAILVFNLAAKSQTTQKIGHVNIQELVQMHPDIDSIHSVLEQERKDMEEVYAEMQQEQQQKMDAFEKESAGYSEFMRKSKQDELLTLAQKIQNYNQNASQLIRQRNMELIQPLYDEVNEAIQEVSEEEGFTYVLDISNGSLAFIAKNAPDITPKVKEKLGIK